MEALSIFGRSDHWVKESPSLKEYHQPSLLYVSQLILAFSDSWNVDLLNSIFPPEMSRAICRINLSSPLRQDYLSWPFSNNGEYSVKSGLKVLQQSTLVLKSSSSSSSFTLPKCLWRFIGGAPILPRIKYFLWSCAS